MLRHDLQYYRRKLQLNQKLMLKYIIHGNGFEPGHVGESAKRMIKIF